MKEFPRIIFFGTPDFAVASLQSLVDAEYRIVGVVTAPDRISGRGLKIHNSPVKEFALLHNLPLFQPVNLKDPDFLRQLKSIRPDIQVVVAFRMLPKEIWSLPVSGTFNLHASLLPQYRGAAPINWVLINGEKETGVTTFFLDEQIDNGNIIFRETLPVGDEETAGELHDRLMAAGARLVVKTMRAVESGNVPFISQEALLDPDEVRLKKAPKIHKEDCRIEWKNNALTVFNFIRGMSPHPGAFTELIATDGTPFYLKVFRVQREIILHTLPPGTIKSDGRTYLKVAVNEGFIQLSEVQIAGRKVMDMLSFLKGYGFHFV
ncbi:MAG: methionyl-tRNA formyltransferase [Bacteroidales bacterium]|jgi:methionyl-tRNA formyltransferase